MQAQGYNIQHGQIYSQLPNQSYQQVVIRPPPTAEREESSSGDSSSGEESTLEGNQRREESSANDQVTPIGRAAMAESSSQTSPREERVTGRSMVRTGAARQADLTNRSMERCTCRVFNIEENNRDAEPIIKGLPQLFSLTTLVELTDRDVELGK